MVSSVCLWKKGLLTKRFLVLLFTKLLLELSMLLNLKDKRKLLLAFSRLMIDVERLSWAIKRKNLYASKLLALLLNMMFCSQVLEIVNYRGGNATLR